MAAMADETSTAQPQGGRTGGNREAGGFRIRLSDNELRAARAVQEAFRLRSTVAVLGFCLRTVAQLLEEGKLDALVNEVRSQPAAADGPREGHRDGGRDGGRGGRRPGSEGRGPRGERPDRVDPFARPSRPKPSAPAAEPVAEADGAPAQEESGAAESGSSPAATGAEAANPSEAAEATSVQGS